MSGFRTYERDPSNPKGFRIASLDEIPPDEIYVLDTETTGLSGAPKDLVVDVGICRVSLRRGTVEDVYSSVLGYDVDSWDDYHRNAWIFENTDMTLEMVAECRVFQDRRWGPGRYPRDAEPSRPVGCADGVVRHDTDVQGRELRTLSQLSSLTSPSV